MIRAGVLESIYHYPVKSFAGERLTDCSVESYGLYGDRFAAFYDEALVGWDSYLTAREAPRMLAYRAKLEQDTIIVDTPDGRKLGWDDRLLQEIQGIAGDRKIARTSCQAAHLERSGLLSVDIAGILLITDRRLRSLEYMLGRPIDPRRFRPNLIISLDDETDELEWIGNRLRINDAEFLIDRVCRRCPIITVDPETTERDVSILRIIEQEMDSIFGLYASVSRAGRISVGDEVSIIRSDHGKNF